MRGPRTSRFLYILELKCGSLAQMGQIPEALKQTIIRMHGTKGEEWLSDLPALQARLFEKWKLVPDGEFAEITFNYALPVISAEHGSAVLKLGPHVKGRVKEANALKHYSGRGAAKLYELDNVSGGLLVERLNPGKDLNAHDLDEDSSIEVAAKLISQLTSVKSNVAISNFTPVQTWGLGFEKFLRENSDRSALDPSEILTADSLFKKLVQTSRSNCILHGDLHQMNILFDNRREWLAIDPKGLFGDPAYEVGAFVRNPVSKLIENPDLSSVLENRILRFSKLLGFSRMRVWGWSYSQCVLAAIWSINEGDEQWREWLKIARVLRSLESKLGKE